MLRYFVKVGSGIAVSPSGTKRSNGLCVTRAFESRRKAWDYADALRAASVPCEVSVEVIDAHQTFTGGN